MKQTIEVLMERDESSKKSEEHSKHLFNSLSSNLMKNIVEEESKEIDKRQIGAIETLVQKIMESGLSEVLSGDKIQLAVESHRKQILSKSFDDIAEEILKDSFQIVDTKENLRYFSFSNLLVAEEMAFSLKKRNYDTIQEHIKELFLGRCKTERKNISIGEFLNEDFLLQDGSAGLVFLELIYTSFYSKQKESKPAIHSPVFESLISYS